MNWEIAAYVQLSGDRSVADAFLFRPNGFGDCPPITLQEPCRRCCSDNKDKDEARCGKIGVGTAIGGSAAGMAFGPAGAAVGALVGAGVGWLVDNLCVEMVYKAHGICQQVCDSKPEHP